MKSIGDLLNEFAVCCNLIEERSKDKLADYEYLLELYTEKIKILNIPIVVKAEVAVSCGTCKYKFKSELLHPCADCDNYKLGEARTDC